ncbi:cytochrome P450 [Deinococcus cavernae]|uniref:Cytochrome P450 n=1 Tax=Deinococcus cavernae TaxID=2320857 RepID=A0A418UZT7_9DEIO|nr:cytochrome P450 [Deinococcus cavernae]RJF68993.1 cytochrome P450 [Deinococcus cavernae]
MPAALNTLPSPPADRHVGHLLAWAQEPLALIEQGAELARAAGRDVFALGLGVPAVVGFSPAWNRRLLSDLPTFRSAGSFSALVPYLAGGVIVTDAPRHRERRQVLNPPFSARQLEGLRLRVRLSVPAVPQGPFDALAWADGVVQGALNAAYFSGEFDPELLHAFLAPLRRPFPAPMLPRPLLFRQVRREVQRLARQRVLAPRSDLLSALLALPGALEETRVSLAAAHDTTTHALAYALWHLALEPRWHTPQHHDAVIREVLRLYPPGWMGSRRLGADLDWQGVTLPRGALALYSPYLSGRDPRLWPQAGEFRPGRWAQSPPAWAYLPFGGGERTCLGLHLANLILREVLAAAPRLQANWGDARPHPGLTLGPRGPLVVQRRAGDVPD